MDITNPDSDDYDYTQDPNRTDVYPSPNDGKQVQFVVLYRDYDYPFLETAAEIAHGLESAYHAGEEALEWVKWLDPQTRQLYDVRICGSDASIQRDDRDGAPVFEHRELAFMVHENQVVATANYSIDLAA